MIKVALPKGRILKEVLPLFEKAGYDFSEVLKDDRKLKFEMPDKGFVLILLKPFDVPVYVERGNADIGVVGLDVLMERNTDILNILDLKLGLCRISVAKPKNRFFELKMGLKVGTKFIKIAKDYFEKKGLNIDVIKLEGSVELAPLMGLSDLIVDIVSSGETLRKNGLEEVEKICDISSYLIMNRTFFKTRYKEATKFINKIKKVVE
ncbi:MAG: ATP phosphoribosyltransferase [Proteobacteria bacterium]|nr:ATP phosphoribosyltransferase [Pseudomonadota bacterium]